MRTKYLARLRGALHTFEGCNAKAQYRKFETNIPRKRTGRPNCTERENICIDLSQTHECWNLDEAAQFLFWDYINSNFYAVRLRRGRGSTVQYPKRMPLLTGDRNQGHKIAVQNISRWLCVCVCVSGWKLKGRWILERLCSCLSARVKPVSSMYEYINTVEN